MDTPLYRKTVVVTGATSGIGLAVAEQLAQKGVDVIGVGRSAERCRQAEKRLRLANPDANAAYLVADFSLQSQVRALAGEIRALLAERGKSGLDGLVNNAGTFSYWLTYTPEGFELQWAVNHLAPFLLTHELLPLLDSAPDARVVTVSSGSHYGARLKWDDLQLRRGYNGLRAYGQTKLANILFTVALNNRLAPESTLRALAADPGLVQTDIGLKGTPGIVRWVWERRRSGGVPPAVAAHGIVALLMEPSVAASPEIYWKDGKPRQPSRQALDAGSAARLWNISEQMCGIGKQA